MSQAKEDVLAKYRKFKIKTERPSSPQAGTSNTSPFDSPIAERYGPEEPSETVYQGQGNINLDNFGHFVQK